MHIQEHRQGFSVNRGVRTCRKIPGNGLSSELNPQLNPKPKPLNFTKHICGKLAKP